MWSLLQASLQLLVSLWPSWSKKHMFNVFSLCYGGSLQTILHFNCPLFSAIMVVMTKYFTCLVVVLLHWAVASTRCCISNIYTLSNSAQLRLHSISCGAHMYAQLKLHFLTKVLHIFCYSPLWGISTPLVWCCHTARTICLIGSLSGTYR